MTSMRLAVVVESFVCFVRALFAVLWAEMISRTTGPLVLRFLLEPLMACAFAICGEARDARSSRLLSLVGVTTIPAARRDRLLEGLLAVGRLFLLATMMDAIYQCVVLTAVRPLQATIVGLAFALLPYLLVCGPASRLPAPLMRPR